MDIAADVITIVGLPLAAIAIFVAWRQLVRTATAATAAEDAAKQTSQDLATYQLLTLISESHQIESAIDLAVQDGNRTRTIELLNSWKRTGTEVRGLLDSRGNPDADLSRLLTQSFVLATQTKGGLMDPNTEVIPGTARARETIGEVTGRLGTLGGQLKANIGGD